MKKSSHSIILILIFWVVFIVYFNSKNIISFDSKWIVHTAMSIIKQGNADLDEYKKIIGDSDYRIENINTHIYTVYPIGISVIALPFVFAIDKGLNLMLSKFPRLEEYIKEYIKMRSHTCPNRINVISVFLGVELFIASLIVAITAVFIYLLARLFLDIQYSLLVTFIFAFCTSAWSIASRALWKHGPTMLMLTLALYLILLAKDKPWLIQFVSIPLAFSFTICSTNIISIFLLTAFVLIQYKKYFLHYFLWGMIIIIPFLIFSFKVYCSPYYLFSILQLNPHFFEGLAGNLISPGRGLFIFSPILLFSIFGLTLKIKNKQMVKLDYFLCGIIFFHWISMSSCYQWWAGHSFGPRYLSNMIPYFIYFLIPAVAVISKLKGMRKAVFNFFFFSFLVISLFVHYRGATNWDVYVWNTDPVDIDEKPQRAWDWHDIQFLRGI